ncbi:hypothetical protein [Acidaminococcus sp. AM05-11]|uniref:hypothetical protein n=1 Tax=Acidaminococcus sp. AM05-11 TaxID=2291997 RepID=UPI001314D643|nr:hypothetical protein [Acidaminococcus sp. AM05-11]
MLTVFSCFFALQNKEVGEYRKHTLPWLEGNPGIARSDDNNKNNLLCQKPVTAFGAEKLYGDGKSASPNL